MSTKYKHCVDYSVISHITLVLGFKATIFHKIENTGFSRNTLYTTSNNEKQRTHSQQYMI